MTRPSPRPVLHRAVAAVAVAALLAPVAPTLRAAGTAPQYRLKTHANPQAIAPLAQGLLGYDDIVRAAGKAPADAGRRLDDLSRLAPQAKADIRAFIDALRRANEVEAFEKLVYAKADASGRATLSAEIRGQGGPVAVLSQADRLIDGLIAERRAALTSRHPVDRVLESFGLTVELSASILSTTCGLFWFTISLGYADVIAYHSCNDGHLG